jgi:hypothetical protein
MASSNRHLGKRGFSLRFQDSLADKSSFEVANYETHTILNYNSSAVRIYNAKISRERFENKNIFFYCLKTL